MSVSIKRQRNGELRPFWYGEYVDNRGKRKIENLGEWRGTPPPSLLGTGDKTTGSPDFEESRKEAEKQLAAHADEAGRKGRVEHLTERLIQSKTGRAVEYSAVSDLPQRWRNLGRENKVSEDYLKGCDTVFNRFAAFMKTRNRAAVTYLYEVTPEDAAAFVSEIQTTTKERKAFSRKTRRDAVKMLNKSFQRFLPMGAANPFSNLVGKRKDGESETIHRKPFTREELKSLLSAAASDEFMLPLITTAACTGMRRGDVCKLKWRDVDLDGGMVITKASKTGEPVEVPIWPPLRAVLLERQGNKGPLVFPEAARMLADNPDGLTWRFKKIVAQAFNSGKLPLALPEPIPTGDIETEGGAAIIEKLPEGERRTRTLEIFRRYCAGESLRGIVKATGYCKGTVSNDLHAVQDMIGKPFLRLQTASVKKAVRDATQETRAHGQRAASVRDWHALRATFVTLALSAGVPVELVRRVTGHTTVEIVLKHYFRPDRENFKAAFKDAMPQELTGGKKPKQLKAADEMGELFEKLKAGSATDQDKKRLKLLTAKI